MRALVLLTVLCFLSHAACGKPEYPCTYQEYDLSGMYRDANQDDYSWVEPSSGRTFYINICGVTKEQCAPQYNAGNCFDQGSRWYSGGDASSGTFSDYPVPDTEGVTLMYGNGEECNGVSRVTSINVKCDPHAPGAGVINTVDETVSCRYTVSMSSKYACEKQPLPPLPQKQLQPIAHFSAEAFVTTVWPSAVTSISGEGTLSYVAAMGPSDLLLDGIGQHSNDSFGVLSLGKIKQIMKLPENEWCVYTAAYPPVHNITAHVEGYAGTVTYTYTHFNVNKKVKGDAWYGSAWTHEGSPFNDGDDDDDDDGGGGGWTIVLITDPETGDMIWASGSLFYGATVYDGRLAMPFGYGASYEVKPGSYSSGEPTIELPLKWGC